MFVPFIAGVATALATFVILRLVWPATAASGGGLIIGAVAAHAAGSAVACFLQPVRSHTFLVAVRVLAMAVIVSGVLAVSLFATYIVLAYAMPPWFASGAGLVASALIGYAVAAALASRLDRTWNRTAGPLALVVFVLVTTYVFVAARSVTGVAGSPTVPSP